MNENLIQIANLYLKLGELELIKNFSLSVSEGKRVGITGPSGCGKTTLLRSIIDASPPTGSSFECFAVNLGSSERIGYVPQSGGLLPWFSLARNLRYFAAHRNGSEEVRHYVAEVAASVGLSSRLSHFPDQLSGGETQRALLACGMATEPRLFLADEPLTEVDLEKKWLLIERWSMQMAKLGSALFLVSHDIDVLLYLCDEVVVLEGSPARPIHHFNLGLPHPRDRRALTGDEANRVRKTLTGHMLHESPAELASLKGS